MLLHQVQQPPAPPKVGVTAAESGTYTDFANINLGGLLRDGTDGSNELSHLLLDIIDEMHLLQPSSNIQLSRKTPDVVLKHALRVIRKGYGFPSLFNADAVVEEQLRQGKTLEDARAGGCSGCVEVGRSARRPSSSPATSTWSRCSSWRCTTASIRGPASSSVPHR